MFNEWANIWFSFLPNCRYQEAFVLYSQKMLTKSTEKVKKELMPQKKVIDCKYIYKCCPNILLYGLKSISMRSIKTLLCQII